MIVYRRVINPPVLTFLDWAREAQAEAVHRNRSKTKRNIPAGCSFVLEAPPGLEPGVRDLQSRALPLGYGAMYGICGRGSVRKSFLLERLTRLELATSTLARWRSTG